MKLSLKDVFWVFAAGGTGSVVRLGVQQLLNGANTASWPWGTGLVNVLGSFLMGLISSGVSDSGPLRLVLATGLLGGFTTYSAFNQETLLMFQKGHAGQAIAYLISTVGACLFAGALGLWLGQGGP